MSTFVVRNKYTGFYLTEASGVKFSVFRLAHRFKSLEDAKKEEERSPSWREVVRVTYRRKVRRIAVLKVVR